MKYYIVYPDGTYQEVMGIETDAEVNEQARIASSMGGQLMDTKQFQEMTGIPSKEMRAEGEYLRGLTERYIADPKATQQEMIQAGYDPREGGEKALGFMSSFAPATKYAIESDMGTGGTIGAGAVDIGSNVLGMGVGSKLGGAILSKVAPKIGASSGMGANLARGTAKTLGEGVAGATASGVQQGYGQGKFDIESAKLGGGLAGGFQGAGGAFGTLGRKGFTALSSELSGVAPEALEAYAKGGKSKYDILNANTSSDIANNLKDDLKNWDNLIPEAKQVQTALAGKVVNTEPILENILIEMGRLEGGKGALTPTEQVAWNKLNEWFEKLSKMPAQIDANEARKIRSQLDEAIDYRDPNIGQSSKSIAEKAFKNVAGSLRQDLVNVGGDEYAEIMGNWSRKLNAKNELEDILTKNRETSIVDNLFNRNKDEQRAIFSKFDDVFGKNYTDQIRNSAYAKKLGIDLNQWPVDERSPAWASQFTTGRSNTGLVLAGLGGGLGGIGVSPVLAPIAPVALSAWSPRASTALLSESYNPTAVGKTVGATVRQAKTATRTEATSKKKEKKSKYDIE